MGATRYKPYPAYKASGVEWLGDIPEGWEASKVKYAAEFQVGWTPPTGIAENFIGNNLWANISDLGPKWLNTTEKRISDMAALKASMSVTPAGSLLYSFKLSVGTVSFASRDMFTNEAIASFLDTEELPISFLYYLAPIFIIQNASTNIYGAKILNQELIRNADILVPSNIEAINIAAFLDYETAKIDALIAKQERLIALLEEKRQAVISHAVTKGLDPTAPLRPSGIDWLGDVPAHWEIGRVGLVCSYISYGFTNPMPSTDTGPFMLTAADIEFGRVNYQTARRTSETAFRTKLSPKSKPEKGDILITKDGTLGRVALVRDDEELCISQSIALLRVNPDEIHPEYLEALLSAQAYQDKMIFDAGGTTIKHIYISILARMNLTLPPREEQRKICEYVELRSSYFDKLDFKAQSAITLLKERRTALISAAVTGKIDVRDWQAPDTVSTQDILQDA